MCISHLSLFHNIHTVNLSNIQVLSTLLIPFLEATGKGWAKEASKTDLLLRATRQSYQYTPQVPHDNTP